MWGSEWTSGNRLHTDRGTEDTRLDALYFPYLSLPPSTWVNPALLFFDRLALITPDGGGRLWQDQRTRELVGRDMVRPITPRGDWGGDEDHRLASYLLGRASGTRSPGRIARVHAGKLAYGHLASELIGSGLLTDTGGGWLQGPDWVVAHLMSYLALQISEHSDDPLPLITDERAAARVMAGPRETAPISRKLRAVTSLLPVPPDARIADIDTFRQRHRRELDSFRSYVNVLISCDPASQEGEERFEGRLRDAQDVRRHLVGEMRDFNWRERGLAITILALATGAAPLDDAPWTFGAGLIGLGLTGMQALSVRERQRRAETSRMIYAARVAGRWPATAAATLW